MEETKETVAKIETKKEEVETGRNPLQQEQASDPGSATRTPHSKNELVTPDLQRGTPRSKNKPVTPDMQRGAPRSKNEPVAPDLHLPGWKWKVRRRSKLRER